jgi:hypothetical protein
MECLDNVIKLSRTTCDCYDNNKPEDFAEGKSEVYLDELEGMSLDMVASASDCASGGLWDLMNKARMNAVLQFKTDYLSCIGTRLTSKRPNLTGTIGNTSFNSTLNYSENMAGLRIKTRNIVGAYMSIKSFSLMFNSTSTFNIKVYSSDDLTTPIGTYPVTSAANVVQKVSLTDALKLPLWSNQTTEIEYYIVYDLIGTYAPKNNKADCGCTNKQNVAYKTWVTPVGIKGNSSQDLNTFGTTTEFNGLAVEVDFRCDANRLICSDEYPLDFENNDARALNIAYTVRFKAGELLLESILASGNINRYTMLDRETMWGKRNRYRSLYEQWVAYLCENTDVLNSDCLSCRPNHNVSKGSILA